MIKFKKFVNIHFKRKTSLVFLVLISFKVIYFCCSKTVLTPDSHEFIRINFTDYLSLNFDEFRTPLYPLLIDILGGNNPIALSLVTVFQLVLSCVSLIVLYKICILINNNKFLNLIIISLYCVSSSINGWERIILTESISLSIIVLFSYFVIRHLKSIENNNYDDAKKMAIYSIVLIGVAVFFNPKFLAFFIIATLFYVLRLLFVKKQFKMVIHSLLASGVFIILIFGYQYLFFLQYDNFSMSNSIVYQKVTLFADTGLYLKSDNDAIKITISKALETNNGNPVEARFAVYEKFDFKEVKKFTNDLIVKNPVGYLNVIIKIIREVSGEPFINYASLAFSESLDKILDFYSYYLSPFTITFAHGYRYAFLSLVFLFICAKLKKNVNAWVCLGSFSFISVSYLTSVLGTNAEFPRTAIFAVPYFFILLAVLFDLLKEVYRCRIE